MKFKQKIAVLMVAAAIQFPCVSHAAEEDRELALIAAEQEGEDARLSEINSALTDSITTKPTQETDKDIKERKKKLKQTRKEKEKENERKLKEITEKNRRDKRDTHDKRDTRREETIIIDDSKDVKPANSPTPTVDTRKVNSSTPTNTRKNNSSTSTDTRKVNSPKSTDTRKVNSSTSTDTRKVNSSKSTDTRKVNSSMSTDTRKNNSSTPSDTRKVNSPKSTDTRKNNSSTPSDDTPQNIDILDYSNPKSIYANFSEASRAVNFIPLYMPRKSGYEITAIHAGQGIVEIRYGRRWEPTVSLTVRTYHRPEGEELKDISGVTGVKWRVDTSTGTSIYLAKVSDSQHVAAWAVGHFTFSALGENLSFAAFHTLVADELVELSTHYYIDL